jgi:hypothetical protein
LYLQRNILHALAKQLFFLCLAYSQNSFAQSFKVMASEQTIAKILSGKRAQKKLEASATSMISSFNTAANTATEAELEWISNTLRLNMTLMYRIAGMLKNDALISLLDGTLAVDDPGESELPPAKRPRVSLRASIKKFKHLSQAIGLPFAVLYHLEPSVFHTELDWGDCDLIGILARAVGANRETDLPSKHFHGIECVPSLKQALKLRYNELDSLYTNMSPEMIKKGIGRCSPCGTLMMSLASAMSCAQIASARSITTWSVYSRALAAGEANEASALCAQCRRPMPRPSSTTGCSCWICGDWCCSTICQRKHQGSVHPVEDTMGPLVGM